MSHTHTFHEDISEVGLVDDCPRCEEHAKHPLRSLDQENLGQLIDRVVDRAGYRSENERDAIITLTRALNDACALAQANPKAFAKFANERWNVNLIAVL